MKKILTFILILVSVHCFAQEQPIMDKPKVDKRVELLSIVFRLAENFEYNFTGLFENMPHYKLYTNRIDEHFNPYKDHELIRFTKEVVEKNGVSFDAPMKMAVSIDENLNLLVDDVPDFRWKKEDVDMFVELLKKFYQDAKCEEFFKNNESLYTETSERFLPIYEELDLDWFSSFYGKAPEEEFMVINGLAIGQCNYGTSVSIPNQKRKVYAIVGIWRIDSLETPTRKRYYLSTLIHEFNHSFVNYLSDKYEDILKDSGKKIFEKLETNMTSQFYGHWKIMLSEALVRASEIKYMQDHNFDESKIEKAINYNIEKGFLWIRELVAELDNYSKNRNQYPTLESYYMPRLIEAYAVYAENIDKYIEQANKVNEK